MATTELLIPPVSNGLGYLRKPSNMHVQQLRGEPVAYRQCDVALVLSGQYRNPHVQEGAHVVCLFNHLHWYSSGWFHDDDASEFHVCMNGCGDATVPFLSGVYGVKQT